MPALVAGVSRGGELDLFVSGVRKHGDETLVENGDKFHLGSNTKAMTATLVAMLVEQGALKWESTLAELLPELAPKMHPDFRKVTLEQLTAHLSGLPVGVPSDLWGKMWELGADVRKGRLLMAETMLVNAPKHAPGSKHEYSNTNYMVAGLVLETFTKKSWEELMQERLFGPLEMASCGFGAPGSAEAPKPDQPWGHVLAAEGPQPVAPGPLADNPPSLGPAGTVHCSLADWAKFLRLHLDGFNGKATKLLRAESFKKLHEPPTGFDYTAGGWWRMERPWAQGSTLTHGGSNTMNLAIVWLAPKLDMIVFAATNSFDRAGTKAVTAVDSALDAVIEDRVARPGQ